MMRPLLIENARIVDPASNTDQIGDPDMIFGAELTAQLAQANCSL